MCSTLQTRVRSIYDTSTDKSLIIGDDYVLSPKDLCTIEFIDQLIEAGIDSFKIEGRKRSPGICCENCFCLP